MFEDRIGRGGMAVVYRAYQNSVSRHVALKILSLDPLMHDNDDFSQRFQQEAAVIASLEHLHILPVYGYGLVEGEFAYMAMRLLKGGSLADLLSQGPMELRQAVQIFVQAARGLAHAHSRGVIHRDIKPSNILLDENGNAYLSDFGLAKIQEMSLNLTRSGSLVGTPTYIAPELVRGGITSIRSDIYGMGIMLYHMLAGRPPFELSDTGVLTLLYKHVEEVPPSLSELREDIPPEIEAIILMALNKLPEDRFETADAMADALEVATGLRASTESMPMIRVTSSGVRPVRLNPEKRRRRNRIAIGIGIGMMLIVFAVAGILLIRNNDLRPRPATIVADQVGTIETMPLSEVDIQRAQAVLGDDGFIAFIVCNSQNVTFITRAREFTDFAAADGLAVRLFDSENDPYRQLTVIEEARIEGARAFVLCPLEVEQLTSTIDSLERARIPLSYITLFNHPYGVKLDSQNGEFGRRTAEYSAQILNEEFGGEGNVLILTQGAFPAGRQRGEQMEATMRELAPDATILPWGDSLSQEAGYRDTQAAIARGDVPTAILVSSDVAAYGAIQALEEAGLSPDEVFIVSNNAEPQALDYIEEGHYLRGTVDTNRLLGSELLYLGVAHQLAGNIIPEFLAYPPGEMLTADVLAAQDETTFAIERG